MLVDKTPFYMFFHTFWRALLKSVFPIKILNREKLLEEGPVIIVANHQSFMDPPLIGCLYTNPIWFLARKTLFDAPVLKQVLPHCQTLGVNQERPDPAAILQVIRKVKEGNRLIIFPEGARCPDGKIHEAMPGIGLILSKLAGVPVQPVRIEGAYDCLPIWRNKLQIHPITLSVGDPITFTPQELKVRTREGQRAIGKKIMDAIAALPTQP